MFKKRFQAVLKVLGFNAQESENWTQETWDQIAKSYEETHGATMQEDMQADKEQKEKAETYDQILSLVGTVEETTAEGDGGEGDGGEGEGASQTNTPADLTSKVEGITQKLSKLEQEAKEKDDVIATLSQKIEDPKPADTVKNGNVPFQLAHTASHAFGIDAPMYSMDHRWNQIAANPKHALANPLSTSAAQAVEKSFLSELKAYGASLSERYGELKDNNQLGQIKSAAFDVDYSELDALTKNQYVVRRMDALIAQILNIPTIFDMFPRRYGVQDYDIITNALFTEVSAAWQKGKIFKGDVDLQPETGHVDDATIKVLFEPLTDMERKFIGYLNMEGSDPVKWTMIEWYTLNMLTKAVQEQNRRYVRGIYYKPEDGILGSYLNASTGVLHTLFRYQHQFKLLPHADAAFASYDKSTMFATVKALLQEIDVTLEDQEWSDFTLVLNARHKSWFIDNLREEFGQDNDFMGTKEGTMKFPDYDIPIYWLPSMEYNDYTIIVTKPGNIQCIENIPGEMMNLVYQDDFEDITVRSRWKEGVSAAFVGRNFADLATLTANNYYQQQIFMNKSVFEIGADVTEPNAANGYHFLTVDNTAATEIVDIAGAKKGVGYYIEIGGTPTNPSNITKALKFSEITDDWTPTAVGDYILVVLNDAGDKFLELERMVGGVRTVNKTLQPTLPESRS